MHEVLGFNGVEGLLGTGMLMVDLKCKVVATRDAWIQTRYETKQNCP